MEEQPTKNWERLLPRIERIVDLALGWLEAHNSESPEEPAEEALAYRWRGDGLVPILHPDIYPLDGLIGVERSVARLRSNVGAFARGTPALDTLLYGERGTGKSSAVRGLLGEFAADGLRLVAVQRDELRDLPAIFSVLRGRAGRFVLYCDDLSFEEGDTSYKETKAALDGGLESRPENVLIVATSNRRRLITEYMAENLEASHSADGELHLGETTQEKISLSDRFGLLLPFLGFNQETYLEIAEHHARLLGLDRILGAEERRTGALRFALERGTRSGRTARHACIEMLQSALDDP